MAERAPHSATATAYETETYSCGCRATVPPTYATPDARAWVSPNQYALNQGPVLTLIENYRSDLLCGWRVLLRAAQRRDPRRPATGRECCGCKDKTGQCDYQHERDLFHDLFSS
jgi:Putative glucoamylase